MHTLLNCTTLKDVDIICVQEPWTHIESALPLSHRSWTLFVPDTADRTRPRSCIYVNKEQIPPHTITSMPSQSRDITAIAVTRPELAPLILINVYNPAPSYASLAKLPTILAHPLRTPSAPTVLLGDFNLHNAMWNPPTYHVQDPAADDLIDICVEAGLSLRSEEGVPTFMGNTETTIDLIFVDDNAEESVVECRTLPRQDLDMLSDHLAVCIEIDFTPFPPPPQPTTFNYDKADWDVVSADLTESIANWNQPLPNDPDDIDRVAKDLINYVRAACDKGIPPIRPSPHSKRWWAPELSELKREANSARRSWRRLRTPQAKKEWKAARNFYNKTLRRQKMLHFQRYLHELAPTDLYRAARLCRNGRDTDLGIPPIETEGRIASTPEDKAQAFHDSFTSPTAPYDDTDIPNAVYPQPAPNVAISIEAVDDAMDRIHPSKAPGPSGVKGLVIKKLRQLLRVPLHSLITASLATGHYPRPFQESITAILRKPGRPTYRITNSFRPIVMIEALAKCYDVILGDFLSTHLEQDNRLPNTMFGGRRLRSTTDALIATTETVYDSWRAKRQVGLLGVDIKAAFPSVRHTRLIHNLKTQQVPGNLVRLFASYLSARPTAYKIDGVITEPRIVPEGIPQGTTLSVPFSNSYFAPLHSLIHTTPDTLCIGYADDNNALVTASTLTALKTKLKLAGEKIEAFNLKHGMALDAGKTQYIVFTRHPSQLDNQPLQMANHEVQRTDIVKLLGVHLDTGLRFRHHGQQAAVGGKKALMTIASLAKTRIGLKLPMMRRLFLTCVNPRTDYGAVVWHRFSNHTAAVKELEKLQNLAARIMLGAFRTSSEIAMRSDADLLPVQTRLDRAVAIAAVRLLTLRTSNPATLSAIVAQADPRSRFTSPLMKIYTSLTADIPDRDAIALPPMGDYKLGWRPPSTLHIAPTPEMAIAAHNAILADPTAIVLYSDGSRSSQGVGAAVFSPRLVTNGEPLILHYHLGPAEDHLVPEAELVGAHMAVADTPPVPTAHVFMDSQGSLRSLHAPPHPNRPLSPIAYQTQSLIRESPTRFHFHWIPAHEGVIGNEESDVNAKLAAAVPPCSDERFGPFKITTSAIKARVRAAIEPPTENLDKARPHRAIRGDTTSTQTLAALAKLPRYVCSIVVQLRNGHCALRDYLHWRGHRPSPDCRRCREPETVRHYLLLCRRFEGPRHRLRRAVSELRLPFNLPTLLSHPKVITLLAEYILATKRFPLAQPLPFDELLPTGE